MVLLIEILKNFGSGIVFGLSLVIPGVSGGTLAIILGFYDQLLEAVNHFLHNFNKYVKFLVPFGIGIAVGVVAFASVIQFLLTYHSFPAMMFFLGLIVGVIPGMFRRVRENTPQDCKFGAGDALLIAVPFALLVMTAFLGGGDVSPTDVVVDLPFMLFIFVIGIVAAASLLIPGLSGSFVLLVAGIYPLATYAVSSIRLLLTDFGNVDLILDIMKVLAPLGAGVLIGIFLTARLIEGLLKKRARGVFLVVTGLMAGSVVALAADPILVQSGVSLPVIAFGAGSFIIGLIISIKMEKPAAV